MRRQNAQAWERLLSQFQPNWFDGKLSDQFGRNPDEKAIQEQGWRKIQGAHTLWSMYENAQVMLNMADYADRNSDSVDSVLLATLRSDATQIRDCVVIALSRQTGGPVSESTRINVSNATSLYADMVARMAELVGPNSGAHEPISAGTL